MPWPKDGLLHSLRRQRQTVDCRHHNRKRKECNGTGQCRCDVCGGIGEIEAIGAVLDELAPHGKGKLTGYSWSPSPSWCGVLSAMSAHKYLRLGDALVWGKE